jgi:PIN domain nuclease of toxin-antitoxin system
MRILLDTNIFLWFISGDIQLSTDVQDVIRDPDNEIYLSAVSVWEVIVKYQLGRLSLQSILERIYPNSEISTRLPVLPLTKAVQLNSLICYHYIVILLIECLSVKLYRIT